MIRLRVQADEFKRFITGECASLLDLGRQRVKPPPDLHAKPPSDVHAKRLQALPSKGHGLPSCPSDPLSERPRIDDDEYVRSKLAAHEKRLEALGERLEAAMGKRRLAARRQARLVALGRQQGEQRRQCLAALHDLSRTPIPLAVKDGAPGGRLGGARIVPLYQTERLLVMLERRQKARAGREPSAEALGEEAGVSLGASPSRRITSQVKSSCQITAQAFMKEAEAVRGRASVAEASGGAAFAASACTALIEMGEHDLATGMTWRETWRRVPVRRASGIRGWPCCCRASPALVAPGREVTVRDRPRTSAPSSRPRRRPSSTVSLHAGASGALVALVALGT